MKFLDALLKPFAEALKQPVESFIRLETADDEYTLVSQDGSLVSYMRVDGSRQIIGEDEYKYLIEASTVKMGSRFDRPGHAMQIVFVRNPERIHKELSNLIRPNQTAAKNIGLDIDDVFAERRRHLANFLAWEEIWFVLWTRPSSLTKNDLVRAAKVARNQQWVRAPRAQFPLAALEPLRNKHKSYCVAIGTALEEMGIQGTLIEVHDALRAVRANLFPNRANDRWRPCLPGDPIPPRAPEEKNDLSDILWPPLRQQLSTVDAIQRSSTTVQIGDLIWGGVDMTLAPMDPSPFPMMLNRMVDAKVPFRISFLIESGGVQGAAAQMFLASVLAVTNAQNKQVKDSIEALEKISRSEPVVRMRISFATWARYNEPDVLEDRISHLVQTAESWGYCQVSQLAGDPLEAVMSSAVGIACASTAPPAIAPLYEVMKLLPWQRPSSPFEEGAVLFRTPDGRVWPYQTGSSLTTTWFDLIFAQPGAGKSVMMNTLNLGTCLTAGLSRLPYVAVIDIGPSSSGLVSLIRDALPANRRHETAHYRLRMSQEFAINPFDTQLGCRYPLTEERSYLIELLILLSTPPGHSEPYDGIPQLAGLVIDEMYRWRDDVAANAEPRPYLPRLDQHVDEALRTYNLHLPEDPYWWDVVDLLFDHDLPHIANLAQRHAVPTLTDAITAARRPQIRALLEETQIGASAEGVLSAFERMITSAVREFPILSSVTRFEITDSRVTALDLADVCPQGDETADRQTSIMYMLARHALVRSWWLNQDILANIPKKYRQHHEGRLRDISETPKRLCMDEFHRTSGSKAVRGQLIRDVREGRKRGVQIVLASQLLDDFDDDMVDLATGVWVMGTAISDRAVDSAQERFGLSDTARWVIRHRLTGPRSTGSPVLFVLGTNEGRYEQHLISTLGPIELWAFSTTSEDVAIRSRLYTRLGASRARQLLAANFPGGSARAEIRRRIQMRAESGETEKAATGAVVEEIVDELIGTTQVTLESAGTVSLAKPGDAFHRRKKMMDEEKKKATARYKQIADEEAEDEEKQESVRTKAATQSLDSGLSDSEKLMGGGDEETPPASTDADAAQ